ANVISGNVQVGVYITSRDFAGRSYTAPVNNAVSGNTIQNDGVYGVLFYDAPNNRVRPFTGVYRQLTGNRFGGEKVKFRNFLSGFDIRTRFLKNGTKPKSRSHVHHAKTHVAHSQVRHSGSVSARPRVPALFETAVPQGRAHPKPT